MYKYSLKSKPKLENMPYWFSPSSHWVRVYKVRWTAVIPASVSAIGKDQYQKPKNEEEKVATARFSCQLSSLSQCLQYTKIKDNLKNKNLKRLVESFYSKILNFFSCYLSFLPRCLQYTRIKDNQNSIFLCDRQGLKTI